MMYELAFEPYFLGPEFNNQLEACEMHACSICLHKAIIVELQYTPCMQKLHECAYSEMHQKGETKFTATHIAVMSSHYILTREYQTKKVYNAFPGSC